jgi:hypothetical protein
MTRTSSPTLQRGPPQERQSAITCHTPSPTRSDHHAQLLTQSGLYMVRLFSLSLSLPPAHSSIRTNRRRIDRLRSRLSKRYACLSSLSAIVPLHPRRVDVVWSEQKQIGLIDSVFRNYYIPPIIFGQPAISRSSLLKPLRSSQ